MIIYLLNLALNMSATVVITYVYYLCSSKTTLQSLYYPHLIGEVPKA